MIEPSEDSFETMMERKNPSSKQMESSEGSSNTAMEASGSGAQEAAGPASGPAHEMKELPIDLRQDMEEPSSGPHREIKDPPNDLLQDLEESRNGSHQEAGGPSSETPGGMEGASDNPWGAQDDEGDDTDLADTSKEEGLEEDPETSEVMATTRSIISLHLRMQDLREQQRVAEEILMRGFKAGQLPALPRFSGDRREYHEFIVLCQLILQSYPRMFCSDRLRVRYVIDHLSDMALEWATALVQEGSPLMDDFPAFLEAMSNMFEYRQALRVAEDAMLNIRQGTRSAAEYIGEFQGLVPTLGWSDEVLQAHLCQGLSEEIRHYLFRVPQPDSLDSLVVLVLQIEEKLAERRAMLRLPPEARPRHLTWLHSPAPERWMVSSWLSRDCRPLINRDHLFLLLLIRVNPYHSVAVQALVDSGAGGSYMDEKFAQEHYVELYEKPYPQAVQGVDGSLIGNQPVWLRSEALVCMHQNHQESIEFDVVPSPNFPVILGVNWLRTHAPEVDWVKGRCTFHSPYCLQKCFRPPPPCIALEKHAISLLPGLPPLYSDLADVFNPKEADDETSDQPSSDGSDDLSESEPSELQQAGDSDHSETFFECPSMATWEPIRAGVQENARPRDELWNAWDMLANTQDYIQMIPELFDQLHGATWFTKLELRGTVVEETSSMRQAEDVWKIGFGLERQEMESYQPFPISSDPTIPQNVVHCILKDMLGYFVLSYGQDVLIYSMSQEEHIQHVRQVLVRFRHHYVYCSLDRSQFHRHTAEFLGFVITPKGVKLNKSIVTTVTGYPTPGCKKSLQHLIQFIFPYRHFVERFTGIAEPLVRQLLSTDAFCWGDEEQEAFDCLKRAFRKAPLLHHPKPQNPFYLETGTSRTALHASLIQIDDQTGNKVSCAFYSRNISAIEVNYSQLEMRILPIRAAFTVWCRYLENTEEPIMILLNTEDLASLNNDRLTVLLPGHWVFFFSHFHFDVMPRPAQDQGWPRPPVRHLDRRALQLYTAARARSLFAAGGSPWGQSLDSGEEEESEDAPDQDQPRRRTRQQEFLALLPIDQILNSFLAHFSVAQIRAVVLHFFRGLLFWKDTLAVAALLVLLKLKRRLAPRPAAPRALARPPRRWLRLDQAASLFADGGVAAAAAQLLVQVPLPVGTSAVPAEELGRLLPVHRPQQALLPLTRRGLQFTPDFWLILCEIFGARVGPPVGARPLPGGTRRRRLEPHVAGDEDVVLREALQGDLQRSRQCGLHDGLQDTSQDALAAAPQHPQHPPAPLALLASPSPHPPHTRSQEQAAGALIRFLAAIYARAPPATAWDSRPREGARLEELPGDEDGASPE